MLPFIPQDIVNIIADYHDFEKYCKPQHYEKLKEVINDIGDMANIMPIIRPQIVWDCWGPGANKLLELDNSIVWESESDITFDTDDDFSEIDYPEEEDLLFDSELMDSIYNILDFEETSSFMDDDNYSIDNEYAHKR
tara:strand:- start:1923 stop:2333 length:411 start_codon:yes stop_codon:yes gene_type:complete